MSLTIFTFEFTFFMFDAFLAKKMYVKNGELLTNLFGKDEKHHLKWPTFNKYFMILWHK